MPIKENSFRIGCGRYTQGEGILAECGNEILRLGKAPVIIGGETALSKTHDIIEKSVKENCNNYEFIIHGGTCNEERAKELARLCNEKEYDVIVGVGGGVIMDFAKLCGYFAKRPVINIPTSSATCAAYTPLSIRYTPDGRTVGSLHYSYEVDAVICDTKVILAQPVRLLLAGVFDALAKFIEIKQRFCEDTKDYPIGLDYAYVMAKRSYKVLDGLTEKCIEDMKKGEVSEAVEQVIFTTIAATGVISGIARGSNQCALAHKFYETTRFLFNEAAKSYLHGEIVGVGLILQNYFNGEQENNEALIGLMKKYNMPYRIDDVGISRNKATFENYYNRLCASSAIEDGNEEELRKLYEAMEYLWSIE